MRVPTNLVTLRILNTHNSNLVFVRIPTIYNFKKIQNKNIKTDNVFFDFTISTIKTHKNGNQERTADFSKT
ncbi:hypothetical protein [Leptospira interrogans]|uniref:Uncharacterized protein n=1 Tax=Leptospira interrogans str. UI 12621 TaxID=1049937 RepID=A0A0F6H8A1_LEPIR|nr:hypothetical protein [Leptospira interrogans]EKO24472.1 hypothetical protein LEP1GSC104_0731 [Leptospira interrogans str. UI 12621]EKR16165.1 hypothetical protein LEP1GSC019_0208 [Leptospira interrogans serovar Pyrogenes str. 2006006960]QOI35632.1 hypothetical protein LeptoLang_16395 [Leptospira interrogans serovar Icterohaemorrhagiae]